MKKFVIALVLGTVSWISPAFAQDSDIAILDLQNAILNTAEAQKALSALREEAGYGENKAELDELRKEHDDLVEKLRKDMAVMSDEQKQTKMKQVEEKRADIQHVMGKLQGSEKALAQQLLQQIAPRTEAIVRDIIEERKIRLLLDRKSALHVDPAWSITAEVTERLNKN